MAMERIVVLAALLGGCVLSTEEAPPTDNAAPATAADVAGVGECAPTIDEHPCPPWWLSCSNLQLRQAECRTACTTGDRVCAGFDAGACFDDCVAFRYEAYCPGA